jgi:SAM-dependent methyltransferase
MQPFAETLTAACVNEGESVLDVACGTGIAARAAAVIAGESGLVVGTDINAPMLHLAETISRETGDRITWDKASALDLRYEDGRFDRVICQQGVQFFPDPAAGLKEMARVARPGGGVAVTVWSDMADSPYLEGMYWMLHEFCGIDPEDMTWSSTSHQIEGWFEAAGLSQPEVRQVARTVSLPPPLDYIPAHMLATPWAQAFDSLPAKKKEAAVEYMAGYVEQFVTETGADIPFRSHLATASV